MCKKFIAVVVLLLVLGIFSLYSISPSLNREWSRDQAVLPVVEFVDEDSVHIKNVRNFIYSSTTEYVVQYYDTTVDISTLSAVFTPMPSAPWRAHCAQGACCCC